MNERNERNHTTELKQEPNVATGVIYHVQKAARQGYIFVSVAFVALFAFMTRLLIHQMNINQRNAE